MADALELGPDDYSQIYSFLTSDNPSERTLGQQMSKKLTAKEQQAFFDFQKTFAVKDAERNRVDNSVGGLPPEMAALSLGNVGRAIGGAGLTAAQRAVAGVKAVAGQAAPVIKYELVKGGLHAMGAPEPIPMVGGMLASGYRMGKAAPSAAAPAAAEAAPAAMSDIQLAQQELAAGRLTPQQYANIARSQAQRPPVAPQGPPAPAPMPSPVVRPAAPEPVAGPSEPPPTPTEAPKPAGPAKSPQQIANEEALARRRAAYQESLKAQPAAAAPADPAAALKASSSFANLPTDAERTFPPNKSGLPFNAPRVVKARGKIADLADMPPSEPAAPKAGNGRELTPDVVKSAATDAGNRSMRAAGRKAWNEDDYKAATAEYTRLNPSPEPAAAAGPTASEPPSKAGTIASLAEGEPDYARVMSELQKVKPRPINKLFGSNGPTPEQRTDWDAAMKAWNKAYRAASAKQKIQLAQSNEAFYAARKAAE